MHAKTLPGQSLHDFDLALCDYIRNNIRARLPEDITVQKLKDLATKRLAATPEPARQSASAGRSPRTPDPVSLLQELFEKEAFAWVLAHERLDADLLAYLVGAERQDLLLSETEIERLCLAADDLDSCLRRTWLVQQWTHLGYFPCVAEVRRVLGAEQAKAFTDQSVLIRKELDESTLKNSTFRMDRGISLVGEWIELIRQLLLALDRRDLIPLPLGFFPSPSTKGDTAWDSLTSLVKSSVHRLRTAFSDAPGLSTAKMDLVIVKVGGNRQAMQQALSYMADKGEYKGRQRRLRGDVR